MDDKASAGMSEKDRARLEQLRPIDDDFMRVVFQDSPELAQEALRLLTGVGDLTVERFETQRDLKKLAGARSVELDVWATDAEGKEYDIEVQTGDDPDPRRARYYSAAMDTETLAPGKEFRDLPEQWVIFVMEKDPYGGGKETYSVERRVDGGAGFGDGSRVLYANAACTGKGELADLLRDFAKSDPDEMSNRAMADRVRYLKKTEKGVAQMCAIWDEIREEGEQRALITAVRNMMETLHLTAAEALAALKVPEQDRAAYLALV